MQSFLEQLNALMTFPGASKFSSTGYHLPNERLNLDTGNRSQTGFVGVTLHKRTQRYEAHIWSDKKQIYLGSYCDKAQAARAHDLMALKVKGQDTLDLNFSLNDYKNILMIMDTMAQADIIGALRSHSKYLNSFARSGQPMLPDKGKQEEHPPRQLAGPPEGQSARVSKRKQARPSSSLGSYLALDEPESIDDRHYPAHAVTKATAVPRHPTINSSTHKVGAGSRTNSAQHVARKPKSFTAATTTTKNDPNRNGESSQAQAQAQTQAQAQAHTTEVKGEKESTLQEEGHARQNQSEEVKATKKSSTLGTPRMERESIPGKRMDQEQEQEH